MTREARGRGRRGGGAQGRVRAFVREYTAGVSGEDVRRLFERDAAEAWSVLTRDRDEVEPKGGVARLAFRVRVFLLGVSYKLSPPRRMLFAAAVVATALALFGSFRVSLDGEHVGLSFDGDPLWYLLAIGCLGFLLALELVDRVRVRDELEVARQLQVDLLPQEAPDLPGWSFAHTYRTANEVGGDYYDFAPLPDGRVALVMGDASGHGMAAGLLMAIANATLHTAVDLDPAPVPVARILNRALLRAGDRRAFMTLFYGLLDPATGDLDYLCAGHPFPLLRRASGGVEELGAGGFPLGIRSDLRPAAARTRIHPGDLLLLFTDGLPEAVGESERAFGFERVEELVRPGGTAGEVRDRILTAFDDHLSDARPTDDLSLVALQRLPAAVPPPPPSPP